MFLRPASPRKSGKRNAILCIISVPLREVANTATRDIDIGEVFLAARAPQTPAPWVVRTPAPLYSSHLPERPALKASAADDGDRHQRTDTAEACVMAHVLD
jgi:hypothetical protein